MDPQVEYGREMFVRSNLQQYFEVVSHQDKLLRCLLAGTDGCKLDGDQRRIKYSVHRGWFNFERHLNDVHRIDATIFGKESSRKRSKRRKSKKSADKLQVEKKQWEKLSVKENYCLICRNICPPPSCPSDPDTLESPFFSRNTSDQINDLFPGGDGIAQLSQQLFVTFFLRQIVHFPAEKMSAFLKRCNGQRVPESWFSMCGACKDIILSAVLIHRRLVCLQKQFEGVKRTVKSRTFESIGTQAEYLSKIEADIREYILETELSNSSNARVQYSTWATKLGSYKSGNNKVPRPHPAPTPRAINEDASGLGTYLRDEAVPHVIGECELMKIKVEDPEFPDDEVVHEVSSRGRKRPKRNYSQMIDYHDITEEYDTQMDSVAVGPGNNENLANVGWANEHSDHWEPDFKRSRELNDDVGEFEAYQTNRCGEAEINIVRQNLQPYYQVVNHAGKTFKCRLAGKDQCKLDGWNKKIRYCPHRGWYNFERHLKQVHKIEFQPTRSRSAKPQRVRPTIDAKTKIVAKPKPKPRHHDLSPTSNESSTCTGPEENPTPQAKFEPKPALFICELCPARYKIPRSLKVHAETHEISNTLGNKFDCEQCGFPFTTEISKKNHMATRHGDAPVACTLCDHVAQSKTALERHVLEHRETSMKQKVGAKFYCPFCSRLFKSYKILNIHKRNFHHKEMGVVPIQCEICLKIMSSQKQLKLHIRQAHDKECRYFCEVCGKGELFKNKLERHMQSHRSENLECEICGSGFKYQETLRAHMLKFHPDDDPAAQQDQDGPGQGDVALVGKVLSCKHCELEFATSFLLSRHLKTHKELFSHECDQCDKSYATVQSLRRHKEINHGDKLVQCSYCKKEFPHQEYVRAHYKYCKLHPNWKESAMLLGDPLERLELECDPPKRLELADYPPGTLAVADNPPERLEFVDDPPERLELEHDPLLEAGPPEGLELEPNPDPPEILKIEGAPTERFVLVGDPPQRLMLISNPPTESANLNSADNNDNCATIHETHLIEESTIIILSIH